MKKMLDKVCVGFVKFGFYAFCATAFVACNNPGGGTTNVAKVTNDSAAVVSKKIVYVNSDSLAQKYDYFKDVRASLEDKAKKAQADLQSRSSAFQREIAEYNQKAPTMSAADRQSTEERLARKQDELARYQQNASASLAQDETTEFEKLYSKITEYLKAHSKTQGYEYVLTYSSTNPAILFADESLEITNEVLSALNAAYQKEKQK